MPNPLFLVRADNPGSVVAVACLNLIVALALVSFAVALALAVSVLTLLCEPAREAQPILNAERRPRRRRRATADEGGQAG